MKYFAFSNYVDFLRERINDNSSIRGYQTKLAKAAGCSPSFLTHVLNGRSDLNLEQAAALCEYWELGSIGTDFFLALVNFARSNTDALKKKFLRDIARLRYESAFAMTLRPYSGSSVVSSPEAALAYLGSWSHQVLHAAIGVKELRTAEALSRRFNLPIQEINFILSQLVDMNLARYSGGEWIHADNLAGTDVNPGLLRMHHWTLRQQANLRVGAFTRGATHLTGVLTIAKEDVFRMKEMVDDLAAKQMEIARKSKEEAVVAFCYDFFEA